MSNRWFRLYTEIMRDPKVLKLSDRDFRMWIQFLCIAAENDGHLPCASDLARICAKRGPHLARVCAEFVACGLLDVKGDGYTPHGWEKRQYKSDSSTERVKKHRAKRNVSETLHETAPDTETESETEKSTKKEKSKPPDTDADFSEFMAVYPRRTGSNPAKPARLKFDAAVKAGADPQAIIAGARRYAIERNGEDPKFTAMASTWLNQERWAGYGTTANGAAASGPDKPAWQKIRTHDGRPIFGASKHTYDLASDKGIDRLLLAWFRSDIWPQQIGCDTKPGEKDCPISPARVRQFLDANPEYEDVPFERTAANA